MTGRKWNGLGTILIKNISGLACNQWVSLERFMRVKSDINTEMIMLSREVKRLTEENEAYKVLLRDKLNQED